MCNAESEMPEGQSVAGATGQRDLLVLGVDTCGHAGTVVLARIEGENVRILGQKELAGRTYSATLVAAVADLLAETGLKVRDLGAIVVVSGPGSFTGVRVGLSAVKGLAQAAQIQVVAVSRLAVLSAIAGVESAALDAHRNEVFLRAASPAGDARELLAGAEDLADIRPVPGRIAVCDEEAATLLSRSWPGAELVRTEAPTAADAIRLCVPRILASDFEDVALLDGHYLRRSDAEIFGEAPRAGSRRGSGIHVRRMTEADLAGVVEIAGGTAHAPKWPLQAYVAAVDPKGQPRRIALVAEERPGGGLLGFAIVTLMPPAMVGPGAPEAASGEAELESIVTALPFQRRGVARELYSALQAELRHAGVTEAILEVREGNQAARSFYRFLGFSDEGRRPGYYADPAEDAILMRMKVQ